MGATRGSIKGKLRSMILVTSAAVLSLTSVAFVAYEVASFKSTLVRNVAVLAQVVADNSAAAVAFQNPAEANQVLAALRAEPSIIDAILYDRENKFFARYPASKGADVRSGLPAPAAGQQYRFEKGTLVFLEPVEQAGNRLGTLVLRASLDALYERLKLYTGIVLLVMAGSLLMAYIFSTVLQRRISHPILALAETARIVTTRNDYSVRARKLSADEVGLLTDAFNRMLQQIEENRAELGEAHEEIRRYAQNLEKTVAERTAKLQVTIGELEAFSYSVSHDMRAPLRAMSRYAEILLQDARDKLAPAEQDYVQRIVTGAKRLDLLIQDALTYSRVSRSEIEMKPVDVDVLIRAIIEQYPQLNPGKADIEVKSPLLRVIGHEASLSQCLSNLLVNAVKFIAPGTRPRVVVWTQPVNSDVRICVKDNGIGIAPEDQGRIFGMFARIYSDKVYEGTGIGLAIVRKAVERMGGSVGVESEIGKGSTFWLQLKGEGGNHEANNSTGGR